MIQASPPFPEPPREVIINGYGEYLVYRASPEKQKEPISESEYGLIFELIEETRSLTIGDRCSHLKSKIQEKLGPDIDLGFIPRTLYELIYLRECIQQDLDQQKCSHFRATEAQRSLELQIDIQENTRNREIQQRFWQLCLFTDQDYLSNFSPRNPFDFRMTHLRNIAARLNQVALERFEGFSFKEITRVLNEMLHYFKEHHDPAKVVNIPRSVTGHGGIAREFAEETTRVWGGHDQFPQGIFTERHQTIVRNAIQLECSAVNCMILYRGAKLLSDALTQCSTKVQSLSFGTGLFAGAIYDGGASPFHFMRQSNLDAQAFLIPQKKIQSNKIPFHIFNVHPLIQLMSVGEIFHGRTKVWKINPEERVSGFLGGDMSYFRIEECCKTDKNQEEMEKKYQKYKSKALLLA